MIPDSKDLSFKRSPEWGNSVVSLDTTEYALTSGDLSDIISVSEIHVRCDVEFQYRRAPSSPWVVEAADTWICLPLSNPVTPILFRTTAGAGSLEVKAFGVKAESISQAPGVVISPLTIEGVGYVGYTLRVSRPTVFSRPPIRRAFQWYRNGVAISGESGTEYVVTLADEGVPVTCREVGIYGLSRSAEAVSNAIEQWVPTDLASLLVWWDPTDLNSITHVLGRISNVAPRFGANALTQGTGADQPRMRDIDGRNVIECDGFGKSLNFNLALAAADPFTAVMAVFPPYAYAGPISGRLQLSGTSGRFTFTFRQTAPHRLAQRPSTTEEPAVPELVETAGQAGIWIHDKPAGADYNLVRSFRDGSAASTYSGIGGAPTFASVNQGRINAVAATGNRGTCTYGEIFIANTQLSNDDRAKAEGYIWWRNRLTADLPTHHPYKQVTPTP